MDFKVIDNQIYVGTANNLVLFSSPDSGGLYVGATSSNGYGGKIYRTTDVGQHWPVINYGLFDSLGITAIGAHNALLIVGSNSGRIFRSFDDALNWKRSDGVPGFGDINAITILGSTVYLGTFYGVFASTDSGSTWIWQSSNQGRKAVRAFLTIDTNMLAGTSMSGVLRRAPRDTSWGLSNAGMQDASIIAALASGGNLLIPTYFGLWVSVSNGNSWIQAAGIESLLVNVMYEDGPNVFAGTDSGGL